MKLFTCQHCGQLLYFENTSCERCGRALGFLPEYTDLSALEPEGGLGGPLAAPARRYRACANAAYDACNWQVEADATPTICVSCRHNRTVPDLSVAEQLSRNGASCEFAKNRLIYTMLKLGPASIRPRPRTRARARFRFSGRSAGADGRCAAGDDRA